MIFSITSEINEFYQLREEWNALLKRSGIVSPFLTWEWLYTWWEIYEQNNPQSQLAIIIAKENGKIVGILPGYIKKILVYGIPVNVFYFLGTEHESSDYLEIIAEDIHNKDVINGLLSTIFDHKIRIDILSFWNVLEDRKFLDYLKKFARSQNYSYLKKFHRICPYILIEGSFDQYLNGLGKKMRRNIRSYTRKLFDKMGADFDYVRDENLISQEIDRLFILHHKRFQVKQKQSIFQTDSRGKFHKKIGELFWKNDILRLYYLRVHDQIIAMIYVFEYGKELFAFQSGMDPEWARYSPQTVLYGRIIQEAFSTGMKRFDFMRGTHDYKFRWTNQARNMVVVDIGTSAKGKLALGLKKATTGAKNFVKHIVAYQSEHN